MSIEAQTGARAAGVKESRPVLRLVHDAGPILVDKPPAQPEPFNGSSDPLERPIHNHCGLCGKRIEDLPITECRTSGKNLRSQIWHYHEICWKQLDRMRQIDSSGWRESKAINPDTRYSALGSVGRKQGEVLSSLLSWTPRPAV